MNPQIRHVSLLVTGMFLALLVSLTSLQGFARPALWESSSQYGSLTEDSRNARTIYQEYGKARGAIMVDGTAVAASVKSSDSLGYQRVYSNGPLYASVTGYYSTIFSNMTGIENAENTVLNGSSPSLWRSRIQNLFTGDQPQGGSVELTINPTLQKVAYQALGTKRGAVVALNPKTGAILAMVSTPSFDPNLLASHDGTTADTAWKQLNSDSGTPLINRAIGGDLYPPGSTFKVITAAAALRLGKVTPDSQVDAPDTVTLPGTTHQLQNYAGESCGNGK
ncbi:penicillin-binding transpeptidase domain-containing protein, partial [Actinomyces graevenitzii]